MNNVKKNVILLGLSILVMSVQGNDSLKVSSFNSFKINDFLNHWSESENVTGMIYNRFENISDFTYQFNKESGDFHRIMEASDVRTHTISTKSLRKIKKFNLLGGFTYNNNYEKGSRWNGTFEPYRGNPYIFGDSVSNSIYRKEQYKLSGAIATSINDKFSIGCNVSYEVGVGAKQKDPRPENTIVQLIVNPGLIYHKSNFNLGIDLGFLQRKEEINYMQNITDNPDISFFAFKGFGFYARDINMYYFRFQTQNKIFGGFQYENLKWKHPSLTEIRFQYSEERIDDGSSVIIKERGGDWIVMDFSAKQVINIVNGLHLHKLVLFADFYNGDGIEYLQQKVYQNKLAEYVTIDSYLKMNRQTILGHLQYEYQKLKNPKQSDFLFHAKLSAINNSETYYYIPEIFTSDYTNLIGDLSVEKNLYSKSVHFEPVLSASYCHNLSQNLNLSDLTEITKKQMKDIYIQDFKYYTDNKLKFDAQLSCGFPTRNSKSISEYFINIGYSYMKSITSDKDYGVFGAKMGFVF